jgi:alpha-beta hydrolase superfamily lysophospholipase
MNSFVQPNPPSAPAAQPYQRCMVLGGAASVSASISACMRRCAAGQAPDVLLASCGGAIAATIIHHLPDPAAQRAWLSSPAMYQFWCSLRSTPQANLPARCWRPQGKLSSANAPVIPDLFGDYLFDIPPQLPFPPDSGQPEWRSPS